MKGSVCLLMLVLVDTFACYEEISREYDKNWNKQLFECQTGTEGQINHSCKNVNQQKYNSVILYNTEQEQRDRQQFAAQILQGLSKQQKQIPMKFLYDEKGSEICANIQQSKQYYIYHCQKELIETKSDEMLELFFKDLKANQKLNLIDLGAGDATKTKILLHEATRKNYVLRYIPLDISYHSNLKLFEQIKIEFPKLQVTLLTAEFQEGISWVQSHTNQEKNVYLFLGTTISNYRIQQNQAFCKFLKSQLKKGDLFVVGFDIWKDPQIIARAYFDNGYQQQFIINVLQRLNRQLNANFDLSKFYGYPFFDPYSRVFKGIIISSQSQQILIEKKKFSLKKGEVIDLIISKKWFIEEMQDLFGIAGMKNIGLFQDSKKYIAYMAFQKK